MASDPLKRTEDVAGIKHSNSWSLQTNQNLNLNGNRLPCSLPRLWEEGASLASGQTLVEGFCPPLASASGMALTEHLHKGPSTVQTKPEVWMAGGPWAVPAAACRKLLSLLLKL